MRNDLGEVQDLVRRMNSPDKEDSELARATLGRMAHRRIPELLEQLVYMEDELMRVTVEITKVSASCVQLENRLRESREDATRLRAVILSANDVMHDINMRGMPRPHKLDLLRQALLAVEDKLG